VPELANTLRVGPGYDVYDVSCPEPLAGPRNGRHDYLRVGGDVYPLDRSDTDIARPAVVSRICLTEKTEELSSPAYVMRCEPDNLIQLLCRNESLFFVGDRVYEVPDFWDVSSAEKKEASGRFSVASARPVSW